MQILISIVIGAVSGWLGGKVMKSDGSLLRNIILGLVGGAVGGWLGSLVGITATGWVSSILLSAGRACLLIWLARKFLK